MALEVIGAGFGRTGTESMKLALEQLGFAPCYHMFEVLPHTDRVKTWRAAAEGELPDWDAAFAGYQATVDWPGAYYWRELALHWPDAKILLTVRDPLAWWRSIDSTIFPLIRDSATADGIGTKLVKNRVFGGNIDDRDHVIATYLRNTEEVQATFGPDRLLTYELGSGWGPLCGFLGVPVPDMPYPRSNSGEEFAERVEKHDYVARVGDEARDK